MLRRTLGRLQFGGGAGGGSGPNLSAGPVVGISGRMRAAIEPTIDTSLVDQDALELKLSSLLAHEMEQDRAEEPAVPLPRKWVHAPNSSLSTSASRRDWFRLMNFNLMTDRWAVPGHTTTPVEHVRVRIPSFVRKDGDVDGFCDYDPAVDTELPPFLTSEFRRKHLVTLLRHYDPDVVCLNEVNRTFFFGDMWRYVRFLGYGTLYQSSRGARVNALRRGEDANHPRHAGKIPEAEDIGNAMLFHKARFFPLMMPGRDLARHFHFAHIVGLRDKVTNMTLYVACVQLTAGDTDEAVAVRLHETRQLLKLLDALVRNDSDRAHMSCMVCGDLNNTSDEEPCVEALREHFFSTHDIVGGPRWTAWHYRNAEETSYRTYFSKNVKEMQHSSAHFAAEEEIRRFRRTDAVAAADHGKSSRVRLVQERVPNAQYPWIIETRLREDATAAEKAKSPAAVDQLAVIRENMEVQGIVYRAQDFVFYQPQSLALHQVLDVPEDDQVDVQQLFPSTKLPSHHLPLLVDVSFNDPNPDVGDRSLKP